MKRSGNILRQAYEATGEEQKHSKLRNCPSHAKLPQCKISGPINGRELQSTLTFLSTIQICITAIIRPRRIIKEKIVESCPAFRIISIWQKRYKIKIVSTRATNMPIKDVEPHISQTQWTAPHLPRHCNHASPKPPFEQVPNSPPRQTSRDTHLDSSQSLMARADGGFTTQVEA